MFYTLQHITASGLAVVRGQESVLLVKAASLIAESMAKGNRAHLLILDPQGRVVASA